MEDPVAGERPLVQHLDEFRAVADLADVDKSP